jgi:hypothetical protein
MIQSKVGRMTAETYALESAIYRLSGELDKRLAEAKTQAEKLTAIDEYVVEYSFIKVAGSEILDNTIDETLQIYGGNGFSAEYPIELAYRNSRINRIFEGTNEINRLLTSGQLLKRAMKGRIDLMGAVQTAMQGQAVTDVRSRPELKDAFTAVENMKKATLVLAGSAAMTYMQNVEKEQEVMALVSDMIAAIYLSESALLRAEKVGSGIAIKLARLYTFDALDRVSGYAKQALRHMPNSEVAAGKLTQYLPDHSVDLINLRRDIARDVYEARKYPV